MKLKTVLQLLKAKRRIILFESDDGQWIGDGSAAFPLYGLPPMKTDNLCSLLDVSEKQFAQIDVSSEKMPFSTEDNVIDEIMLTRCEMTIGYRGRDLIPLTSGTKIYFIQSGYIKPFGNNDDISFELRRSKNGGKCIAVKEGFFLRGIIAPYDVVTDEFISALNKIYGMSRDVMSEKKDIERQKIELNEFNNMTFEENYNE